MSHFGESVRRPGPCCIVGGSANAAITETYSGSDLDLVHASSDGSVFASLARGTLGPGDALCGGGPHGIYDIRFTVTRAVTSRSTRRYRGTTRSRSCR